MENKREIPTLNEKPLNPSCFFAKWQSDTKAFVYYDKNQKTNVVIENLTFLILNELISITGFDSKNNCGIYSNEVQDLNKQTLTVKSFKGGLLLEGIYSKIKNELDKYDARFTLSVYIAIKINERLTIANLQLSGAPLGAWFDFKKTGNNKTDIYRKAVSVNGFLPKKKGSNNYNIPTFALKNISTEMENEASTLQKQLKQYLNDCFVYIDGGNGGKTKDSENELNINIDDLPF